MAAALSAARKLVVTTHVRMDADGLGCAVALCRAARAAGIECRLVLLGPVPGRIAYLLGDQKPAEANQFAALAADADRIVVLDTCTFAQLEPIAGPLRQLREKVIVIDHHATADDVGAVVWGDRSASSAGVMVAELLAELGWAIDPPTAEALAAAVLSDTGWLRYSNTDERSLRILADLSAAGADLHGMYASMYQSDRPARLALLAAALSSLELRQCDRLAVMTLRRADFAASGAAEDETENFVNEPMRIATVQVSAILVEQADGGVRVSLRSRGSADVAELAKRFGGGGHSQAAGFSLGGDADSARRTVIAACSEALGSAGE